MSDLDLRPNPYVGLRPFLTDDSPYFFGRDQQTAELLDILRQHRFVGVVGSSGGGKSSLVRAGLLPALLGGFLVRERDRWRTVQMKPGSAPLANFARGLFKAMKPTRTAAGQPDALDDSLAVTHLETAIRDGHTDAAIEFVGPRLEPNANLFVLVDQFEELFAFRGSHADDDEVLPDPARRKERAQQKAEAADFVDLLLGLAEQRALPVYVALTMRTDFLGDCDLFYGLPEALNRGRYLVPRMTREQLRDAVECPALLTGGDIAPRLLDHVLNELGDRTDRLPVLQHALLRTWEAWRDKGSSGPVDLTHYDTAGGLERALEQEADQVLTGLDEAVVARVFKRLTDTDAGQRRVRAPARISELAAVAHTSEAAIDAVVSTFAAEGRSFLYRSDDGKPEDPRIDISHESLIRQWTALRKWVDEERRSRDEYRELVRNARKFANHQVATLQNPELQTVVEWRDREKPSPAWARRYNVADDDFETADRYLEGSIAERCRSLAELELKRQWEKRWSPSILSIELVAGVVLAKWIGLVETLNNYDAHAASQKNRSSWGEVGALFKDSAFETQVLGLMLFVAVCVGVTLGLKKLQRSFAFDRIQRSITTSNAWRPQTTEPDQPADTRHHTAYATPRRRMVAGAIDVAVIGLFVWALLSSLPTGNFRYVVWKGDETVTGAYGTEFSDQTQQVPQVSGSTSWTLSYTAGVILTKDGTQTTYPVTQHITTTNRADVVDEVDFWDGPRLKGRLSKGEKDWSLTLSENEDIWVRESASSVKVAKGTVVTFPAPAEDAWELAYESDNYTNLILPLSLIATWLYSALLVASRLQGTLGMRAVGVFRTDVYGKRLPFGRASILFGCRLVSLGFVGLGFVMLFFNERRQTFHDWMTGSVVLRRPSAQ